MDARAVRPASPTNRAVFDRGDRRPSGNLRHAVIGTASDHAVESVGVSEGFYRWFSERRLTKFGNARRGRIERSRLTLLQDAIEPPGDMLEIGPGTGSLAAGAVAAGWRYRAIDASDTLVDALRAKGLDVTLAWAPPIAAGDASCDVVYADQVLEHMSGIDAARDFVAESLRALRQASAVVPQNHQARPQRSTELS